MKPLSGGMPPDPRAAGLNSIEPRVRCFGSGAFDHGAIAPLGTLSGGEAAQPGFRPRRRPRLLLALGYTAETTMLPDGSIV